jgi:CSLREA domain-containing protein
MAPCRRWPTGLHRLVTTTTSLVFCLGFNVDAQAATFVVDSTADAADSVPGDGSCVTSGAVCTLRAAIEESNAFAGADTVSFSIPGPGNRSAGGDSWWAISPLTALPVVTSAAIVINGTTQTTNQGNTNSIGPEIELDGALAGGGTHGLNFDATSDGSTVRGLMINRFAANGIEIQAGANGITVAGNWIGSDGSGASAPGNGNNGINLLGANATIGGSGAGDRNVINNNGNEGINLTGGGATGNLMLGNYIGLEYDGSSGSGNGDVGIALLTGASGNTIGGLTAASRNVISMNFEGLEINSANNVVIGNFIGTDSGGTLDRGR